MYIRFKRCFEEEGKELLQAEISGRKYAFFPGQL
jgi:hypothetical protein